MGLFGLGAIVAHANDRVIGKDNLIPWHCLEDLKFFKSVTKDAILVMGKNTYLSLPAHKLPGREIYVLTNSGVFIEPEHAGRILTRNRFPVRLDKQILIAGGASVYSQYLSDLDFMWVTHLDMDVAGDAYFPEYEHLFDCVQTIPLSDVAVAGLWIKKNRQI